MRIEPQKHGLRVTKSDLSGSSFDDVSPAVCSFENVSMSGSSVNNVNLAGPSIVGAPFDGATIDGLRVTDLLAYWRAGHAEATP